ncbi:ABC transporter ATP-binding protein [Oerskovia jenensis]|uniref:ABC-type lipoprotein export system ATPase subunit n=1 Tax=Oerskovia jenensis TaxID=162169 RepID=A0ABS2LF26_9CELL|nr:ATP-binding cassette domain-containing protein [Oerskovia jenensis]MBM7479020.1 ABC-type lipoprotein export system ATPase subunit [Oerskovia jenensis]
MSPHAAVKLDRVEKKLGNLTVLHPTSFEVPAGSSVAISGPSGSGKSTLMAIVGLQTNWSSGELSFYGETYSRLSARMRTRLRSEVGIAWIPQTPTILPGRSVLDNVLLASRFAPTNSVSAVDLALHLLAEMGLSSAVQKNVSVLSGGEVQRVALVRALVRGAKLILADEPTASLDGENTASVIAALSSVAPSVTLLLATHDLVVAGACRLHVVLGADR